MAKSRQVAALPWRKTRHGIEFLLITSRETKRWVIPKGWPMPHLIDSNAAKREAFEEAGIVGRVRRVPFGQFTYNKKHKDQSISALVVDVYALQVLQLLPTWPERGERKRRWTKQVDAFDLVLEPQLKSLLEIFKP